MKIVRNFSPYKPPTANTKHTVFDILQGVGAPIVSVRNYPLTLEEGSI